MSWYTPESAHEKWPTLEITNAPGAWIGDGCVFGAGCVIGGTNSYWDDPEMRVWTGPAVIGENNTFGAACHIYSGTTIGDANWFGGDCQFTGFPTIGNRNRFENRELEPGKSYCYFFDGCTVGDDNQVGADSYIGESISGSGHWKDEVWGSSYIGDRNTLGSDTYIDCASSLADDCVLGSDVLKNELNNVVVRDNSHVGSKWLIGGDDPEAAYSLIKRTLVGPNRVNVIPNPRAHVGTWGWNGAGIERVTGLPNNISLPVGATAAFSTQEVNCFQIWVNNEEQGSSWPGLRVPGSTIAWQFQLCITGASEEEVVDADLSLTFDWNNSAGVSVGRTAALQENGEGEQEDISLPLGDFKLYSGVVEVPDDAAASYFTLELDFMAKQGKSVNFGGMGMYSTLWMVEAGDVPGDYADGDTYCDTDGNVFYAVGDTFVDIEGAAVTPPENISEHWTKWEWFGGPSPDYGDYDWNPAPHKSMSYHVCDFAPRSQTTFISLTPDHVWDYALAKYVPGTGSPPDEVTGTVCVINGDTDEVVVSYTGVLPVNEYRTMEELFGELLPDTDPITWDRYYYFAVGFDGLSWQSDEKWYYLYDNTAENDPFDFEWYYFEVLDGRTRVASETTFEAEDHNLMFELHFPTLNYAYTKVNTATNPTVITTWGVNNIQTGDELQLGYSGGGQPRDSVPPLRAHWNADYSVWVEQTWVATRISDTEFSVPLDCTVPMSPNAFVAIHGYSANPNDYTRYSAYGAQKIPGYDFTNCYPLPSFSDVRYTTLSNGVSHSGTTKLWASLYYSAGFSNTAYLGNVQRGDGHLHMEFPSWSVGNKVRLYYDAFDLDIDFTVPVPLPSNPEASKSLVWHLPPPSCSCNHPPVTVSNFTVTGGHPHNWEWFNFYGNSSEDVWFEHCPVHPHIKVDFDWEKGPAEIETGIYCPIGNAGDPTFNGGMYWWSLNGVQCPEALLENEYWGPGYTGHLTFNGPIGHSSMVVPTTWGGGAYPDYIPNLLVTGLGISGMGIFRDLYLSSITFTQV